MEGKIMKWKFKVLLTPVLAVLYFGLGCTIKSEAIADGSTISYSFSTRGYPYGFLEIKNNITKINKTVLLVDIIYAIVFAVITVTLLFTIIHFVKKRK